MRSDSLSLPVIDIAPLVTRSDAQEAVGAAIRRACRRDGFFYVVGHGVGEDLQQRLERLSREFFGLRLEQKMAIRKQRAGRAWRGYFPLGAELTGGRPDQKEGIYFGAELDERHPKVVAGTPLHGRNLFPESLPDFRDVVLEYLEAMTRLGHTLMTGISLSLGLEPTYFVDRCYTADPLILFRIFRYPPRSSSSDNDPTWGVGEHTDYGLLTILRQDGTGGLQVKSPAGWIAAPSLPGSFVCNVGDMLDRMTGGFFRSTPHRVRNLSGRARLSFPFFFDPGFDAEVKPIDPARETVDDRRQRWDQASVHDFRGTYGDYLLAKVSKVFPALRSEAL